MIKPAPNCPRPKWRGEQKPCNQDETSSDQHFFDADEPDGVASFETEFHELGLGLVDRKTVLEEKSADIGGRLAPDDFRPGLRDDFVWRGRLKLPSGAIARQLTGGKGRCHGVGVTAGKMAPMLISANQIWIRGASQNRSIATKRRKSRKKGS